MINEQFIDRVINILLEMRLDERIKANREKVRALQGRGHHKGFTGRSKTFVQRAVYDAPQHADKPLSQTNKIGKALASVINAQPSVIKNKKAKAKADAGQIEARRRRRDNYKGPTWTYKGPDARDPYYPKPGSDDH